LFYTTRKVKGLLKKSAEQFFLKSFLCVISELPGWPDPAARITRDQRAAKESAEQFLTLFCVISELPGWSDPAAKEERRTVFNPSFVDQ
jgi:hypothetical protein